MEDYTYTVRASRGKWGEGDETARTDSISLAVLLCESLERCRWYTVELEDAHGRVLWATYAKYYRANDPTNLPAGMYVNLTDIPEYRAASD